MHMSAALAPVCDSKFQKSRFCAFSTKISSGIYRDAVISLRRSALVFVEIGEKYCVD